MSTLIPIRTCVICRKKKPKVDLLRIVCLKMCNVIKFDKNQNLLGRGMSVCNNSKCTSNLLTPKKIGLFYHALKSKVNIEDLERLKLEIKEFL